ncbi:MAG: S-layer homology domain-containing protein [Firmicutes bacterium]|nr:S-layer homology domain-containing protein [Bacillota bacterium]
MKRFKITALLLAALLIISSFPLTAFAGGDNDLSIWAESPLDIEVYSPDEEFAFEVGVNSPKGPYRCRWFRIDPDGIPLEHDENGNIRVLGDGTAFLIFGIPQEHMMEEFIYRCEVTDGYGTCWMDFRCMLLPMGIEWDDGINEEYIESFEIIKLPDKTLYNQGDAVDLSGIHYRVNYKDGSYMASIIVEDLSWEPAYLYFEGEDTVTVRYGSFSDSFDVTVEETPGFVPPAMDFDGEETEEEVDLELLREPDKKDYFTGELIDLSGIKCRLWTTMGFRDITDPAEFTVIPPNADGMGPMMVTVDYKGKSAVQYEINVEMINDIEPPAVPVGPEGAPDHPFVDIPEGAFYENAVTWAYQTGVTDGNGKDKFMPFQLCTRGQVVTFLWRAMGSPEPENLYEPFTDVSPDDYFYKPVLWALSHGITEGTTATTFSPGKQCTYAHILTFLYRALGIGTDGWYQEACDWAMNCGLLKDTYSEEDGFVPTGLAPRCDVVTYLYRAMQIINAAPKA